MRPTPRLARLAALPPVLAFACLAGCNSKSDSNPVATGTNGATQDDISVSAVGALDFVNRFVAEVRPLAEGDFSSATLDLPVAGADAPGGPRWPVTAPSRWLLRAQPEVLWSEPDQSWMLNATQTETSAEGTATVDLHFSVQYLTLAGAPQQFPDSTTATMIVDVSMAIDLAGSSNGEVFELGMGYDMFMAVGGLPNGPYPVSGDGALDMSLLWSGPNVETVNLAIGMDWILDVNVPADGTCPSGAVTMTVDSSETNRFSLVGSYDGSPTYDWTLYEAGVVVDSGSEILSCGPPAL